MTAYHQIFVPSGPVDQLLREIGEACGCALAKADGDPIDFAASLEHVAVDVELHHGLEPDHGIPFDEFATVVTVRDYDRDLTRQEGVARRLFEHLARAHDRLLLVFDAQELLVVHSPGGTDG
jgi:hypothetical protein